MDEIFLSFVMFPEWEMQVTLLEVKYIMINEYRNKGKI